MSAQEVKQKKQQKRGVKRETHRKACDLWIREWRTCLFVDYHHLYFLRWICSDARLLSLRFQHSVPPSAAVTRYPLTQAEPSIQPASQARRGAAWAHHLDIYPFFSLIYPFPLFFFSSPVYTSNMDDTYEDDFDWSDSSALALARDTPAPLPVPGASQLDLQAAAAASKQSHRPAANDQAALVSPRTNDSVFTLR